jgi:D-apionolactonase
MDSLFEFVSSLSNETKWHGNHNDNDGNIILKAGQLSMIYSCGNLRNISGGNREIIRMIYPAVRIKGWLTIKPVISEEEADIHPDSFRIRYLCRYVTKEINFSARYTIEGNRDNSLIFKMEGKALNTFEKNRIGLCVLHPIEGCAGENCIITHTNEETENLKFPMLISPHQPFMDIKSMKWGGSGSQFTMNFFGDIFETEDQRNWTDGSFKTYSTPLSRPYPVTVHKGEKISQRIELIAEGNIFTEKNKNSNITLSIYPDIKFDLPKIGIGRSSRPEPLTDNEIGILGRLRFDHYRVDLHLFSDEWIIIAEQAANESSKLGYPLEIVLFLDENALSQSEKFIFWASTKKPEIAVIILIHKTDSSTPDILTDKIAPLLKKALPGIKIGCGTNANFAQLNRNRPLSIHNDYICYSIHPQEHASDNLTLTENLSPQADTVESAMHFSNFKEIWVSSVNIQRRFNPNAENYETFYTGDTIPLQVDSRLMSLFGACWTAGSLKYLCGSGARGITYFETVGERGIFQGDFPSCWPDVFKSCRGMIFPLFHVFSFILKSKSFNIIKSESSDSLKVDIIAFSEGDNLKFILINYTPEIQNVNFEAISGNFKIKRLNAISFAAAASDYNWIEQAHSAPVNLNEKISLDPFSVSFIDGIKY